VFNTLEQIQHLLGAHLAAEQVHRALLIESHSWSVEPSSCFLIASEHFSSPLMNLGLASRSRGGSFEALVKNSEEARKNRALELL
jgi:hypothetical protein